MLLLLLVAIAARADDTLLSADDAPAAVFADADRFERGVIHSTPELRSTIAARLGDVKPTVWEDRYPVATAFAGTRRLGRAIVVEEIGKHRPITLVVGVDDEHKVSGVAVMVYREAYGGEIRSRRFLAQYRGKDAADPLLPSRDIVNITGATLSARAVGRAVKKAIAVLDVTGESHAASAAPPRMVEAPAAGPCRVREAHYVMGTILDVTVDAPSEAVGRGWIRRAVAEARRLDRELTSFDRDSALSQLNGSAGGGTAFVPPDLFEVLTLSRDLSTLTGGTFDVTVSPAVRLWQRAVVEQRWPSQREIAAVRASVGPTAIRFAARNEVELATGASIELGGVGKGFAVDRNVALMREAGVQSALVNFGESSIAAIGPPPSEPAWSIWMRRGRVFDGPLALRDMALSTSATFGDSGRVAGRRIGHIIDPRSALPLSRAAQATVVAPTGTEAEAWSKALLVDPVSVLARLAARPSVAAVLTSRRERRETESFAALARESSRR
jgi:thiamine biosynthesis lipoprotein